jgi:acetoacetate decarboxylase
MKLEQGGFKETAIYVQVTHKGVEGDYEPFLYVNSPLPLTGGREIWGYQKKMAEIELIHDQEAVRAETTRLGHQIVKGLVVPERNATMEEIPWSTGGVFSLKYIPSAEEGGEPLRQLILTPGEFTAHERSEIDPTYLLEPKKILGGFFGKGDLFLPLAKIVHDYK